MSISSMHVSLPQGFSVQRADIITDIIDIITGGGGGGTGTGGTSEDP